MSGFRDEQRPRPVSPGQVLGITALLAAVYSALGAATLGIAQLSGLAAPIWPAAGVAFVFALTWGWRVLPGVVLGSALVNSSSLVGVGEPVGTAIGVAVAVGVGAALAAWIGALLVRRAAGTRLGLSTPREILVVLLLAGPVACTVNATVGVVVQVGAGVLGTDQALVGWLTWWTGDAIGVILFAPLVLMLLPGGDRMWEGRRWKVAAPSLLIAAALTFAFVQVAAQERARVDAEVAALADQAAEDLQTTFLRHEDVLEGIAGLIRSSAQVTAEEFETFTRGSLERHPSLQALSWDAVVSGEDLAEFVEAQRRDVGLPDFTVTERDADGTFVAASARPEYVVVSLIEPRAENGAALGYDIASDPLRSAALEAARDSGRITGTPRIDLIQNEGSEPGMLALLPVYDAGAGVDDSGSIDARRAALLGYAVGVYRLEPMLAETFTAPQWRDLDMRLVDVTDADRPDVLAALDPTVTHTVDDVSRVDSGATVPLDPLGRAWLLEVTPMGGPLAQPTSPLTPALLLVSLLIVYLLEAFLLLLTGLEQRARREAEESSFEANHDALTGLANRRALLRTLADLLARPASDATPDVLLYCDLDGFKHVNDTGGHEAGDRLLVAVAAALLGGVRSRDVVARMGGDEFAVVLVDCPFERGLQIADGLVERVEAVRVRAGGEDLRVGISVGVTALDPGEDVTVDAVLRRADTACYAAKNEGGERVRVYDPDRV